MAISLFVGIAIASTTPTAIYVENTPPLEITEVVEIEDYILNIAYEYDINGRQFLATLKCESRLDPTIQSEHTYTKDNPEWGVKAGERELSFGIAQIHLPDHPTVTREMALDPSFAVKWAAEHFQKTPEMWTCYRKLFQ